MIAYVYKFEIAFILVYVLIIALFHRTFLTTKNLLLKQSNLAKHGVLYLLQRTILRHLENAWKKAQVQRTWY